MQLLRVYNHLNTFLIWQEGSATIQMVARVKLIPFIMIMIFLKVMKVQLNYHSIQI